MKHNVSEREESRLQEEVENVVQYEQHNSKHWSPVCLHLLLNGFGSQGKLQAENICGFHPDIGVKELGLERREGGKELNYF